MLAITQDLADSTGADRIEVLDIEITEDGYLVVLSPADGEPFADRMFVYETDADGNSKLVAEAMS